MTTWQRWTLSGGTGIAAATLVLIDLHRGYIPNGSEPFYWVFLIFVATAIGTTKIVPAVGLAMGWGAGLTQLLGGIPLTLAELPLMAVLFCAARWGRPGTVIAAGLTAPAAPLLAYVGSQLGYFDASLTTWELRGLGYPNLGRLATGGLALLALPWLLGLTMRYVERANRARQAQQIAEARAIKAQEMAQLKEGQNKLARDVHDVVGHSLAVILAQAESAQFLDDSDTIKLKKTMANIAESARTSLQDVRSVLSPDAPRTRLRMDTLLNGIAGSSGRKVEIDRIGTPRPLPPELEEVAYRVLQEMLTNALKHGNQEHPLRIGLSWPDDDPDGSLQIEVTNTVDLAVDTAGEAGSGLDGIRRRLASVGGQLAVRREVNDQSTFTATAWVPVRDRRDGDDWK